MKNEKNNLIALVHIYGPIRFSHRRSSSGQSGADAIINRLRDIAKRDNIKAVILRINSPGGSVAAVQEIHSQVKELREKGKVVVASMGDVAASGGYYVASACDRIIANPGTITGSIGVIMQLGNFQELLKKVGYKVEVIKSGKMKDAGSPFRKMKYEERVYFQKVINNAYEQFLTAVLEGRKMERSAMKNIADGRIFTGEQALQASLVDDIGGLNKAIEIAKELAHIEEEKILKEHIPSFERFLDLIRTFWDKSPSVGNILPPSHIRLEYILD